MKIEDPQCQSQMCQVMSRNLTSDLSCTNRKTSRIESNDSQVSSIFFSSTEKKILFKEIDKQWMTHSLLPPCLDASNACLITNNSNILGCSCCYLYKLKTANKYFCKQKTWNGSILHLRRCFTRAKDAKMRKVILSRFIECWQWVWESKLSFVKEIVIQKT